MAKIIKVGSQTITPSKNINTAKTTRTSTTNPFERNPFMYSNFEGTTLPFADVFEGFKPSFKGGNKLKMVAASVAGSMNKIKTSIPESITRFVNKVRDGFTAFNELHAVKTFNEVMNTPIEINIKMPNLKEKAVESITNIREGISNRVEAVQNSVIGIKGDFRNQWANLIAKIPSRTRYTAETPVSELETALRAELALLGGV